MIPTKTTALMFTTVAAATIGASLHHYLGDKIPAPSQQTSKYIAAPLLLVFFAQTVCSYIIERAKELGESKGNATDKETNSGLEESLLAPATTKAEDSKKQGLQEEFPGRKSGESNQTTSAKSCTQSNGFSIGMVVTGGVVGVATGYLGVVAMGLATSKLVAGITLGAGVVTMAGAGWLYRGCKNPCKNTSEDQTATTTNYTSTVTV